MSLSITPIYAALLAIFFATLSLRVINYRKSAGIALGDGNEKHLLRRQRVHGNFAEYVPFILLLILLCELQGTPAWALHGMGLLLLAGRAIHAYGVSQEPEVIKIRVIAMSLTFATMICAAITAFMMAIL